MWADYGVDWRFTGKLMAGTPADPAVMAAWLETRGLTDLLEESLAEVKSDEERKREEAEQKELAARLVFKRNKAGLFVEGYTIKAHLKDCANQIKGLPEMRRVTKKSSSPATVPLRSMVANKVYVAEEHVPLLRATGEPITEPDGQWEHAVQVMTRQGPRSAIKCNDWIEGGALRFTLRVLSDGVVTPELMQALFEYGQLHGYGAERGLGYGRYQFTVNPKE